MVGVVNPPSNATIAGYATGAKNATSNVAPASTAVGGNVTTISPSRMAGTARPTAPGTGSTTAGQSTPTRSSPAAIASAGGAKQTAGIMGLGLMAVGGFAALMA